jgi:hypothetical protein
MVATELLILGALDILCLLSIAFLALWMRRELEESVAELDSTLAQAIQSTLDKLTGEGIMPFEPPNPIQAALAQMISSVAMQKMNTIDAVVQPKAADGKFQSTIDEFQ